MILRNSGQVLARVVRLDFVVVLAALGSARDVARMLTHHACLHAFSNRSEELQVLLDTVRGRLQEEKDAHAAEVTRNATEVGAGLAFLQCAH